MNALTCQISTALLALISVPPVGATTTWQLVEAKAIPTPNMSPNGTACSAYDSTVCAQIGHFYEFKQKYLNRITGVVSFSDSWGVRVSRISGATASKLTVEPRFILGFISSTALRGGGDISYEVFGSLMGRLRHKPCLDAYGREYYCGSLTAWSDFDGKTVKTHEFGFKIVYRY